MNIDKSVTLASRMAQAERLLAFAACVVASAALVFLCSSTSPLFSIMSDDSSIFLVIGKYWHEGVLPYRDLWDSKGPFLFLVNAIGYGITQSALGVALIQVAFMSFTLLFTYRLLRCEFNTGYSALFTGCVFSSLAYVYGSGDTAEEFVMPLIAWLFYRLHRWLDSGRMDFAWSDALVCGVTFGLCLGTRLTNAIGICAASVAVAGLLATRRQWAALLGCAAAFIVGSAVAVVPFVAYFASHNALGDLVYGALLVLGFPILFSLGGRFIGKGWHSAFAWLPFIVALILFGLFFLVSGFGSITMLFLLGAAANLVRAIFLIFYSSKVDWKIVERPVAQKPKLPQQPKAVKVQQKKK